MINPLIVCALKDEFNIETERYSLLHTGVGKVNAAISLTEYLLTNKKPDYVINYGTAGSKKIDVGDLVDCTKFIQRDMDASKLGFDKYETPFDGKISIEIDNFVEIKIKETDPGLKGDTATNTFKPAILENGLEIKVPLFISPGDYISVDTRNMEYQGRANK